MFLNMKNIFHVCKLISGTKFIEFSAIPFRAIHIKKVKFYADSCVLWQNRTTGNQVLQSLVGEFIFDFAFSFSLRGIAGLSCGRRLTEKGFDVSVFDTGKRAIGGTCTCV